MNQDPKYNFFTEFQDYLFKEHMYTMDKLNPTKNFWWYHPLKQERIFREIGYHSYHLHYAKFFNDIRYDVKKVLEIGVFRGHSMLMWQKYFPNAEIYGVDIDYTPHNFGVNAKELCKDEPRIKLLELDACVDINVEYLKQEIGVDFDIVIDDGSHHPYHQLFSLVNYTDFIKRNGYFVVEDVFMKEQFNENFLDYFNSNFGLYKKDKFFFDDLIKSKPLTMEMCGINILKQPTFNNIIKNWKIDICPPVDYVMKFTDVDLKGGDKIQHYNNRQGIIFFKKPNQ